MGRPRSFDETDAVEAAAAVFRERGYTATSIDHLVAATGMHRGSLYGVFGSKHGLFVRVLEAARETKDEQARLDILLVALHELAPTDDRVADQTSALMHVQGVDAEQLGRRILERARLGEQRKAV